MFLLVDEEITLRELALKDALSIFNTIDTERDYLSEWLPFVELTQDITFTSRFIENYLKSEERDLTCIIRYRNRFVGLIGLKDTDYDNHKTEIGYWISEKYQGKGIVTRACRRLIDYAFDDLKLNRIQIKAATGNLKSQRIPEKLGFAKEGIERDGELHDRGYVDLIIYGLLKKDWKK